MFEPIETARLRLRKPERSDARTIFARYASDPEVTRLLGWPRHTCIEDTLEFLKFSDEEWERWPAGALLIESRETGTLLGSTGLAFETTKHASTGYVLAKDAWGRGYATEALLAVVQLARQLGIGYLYALCHPANGASVRVLEKAGFAFDGLLARHTPFPNLGTDEPQDVLRYARRIGGDRAGHVGSTSCSTFTE